MNCHERHYSHILCYIACHTLIEFSQNPQSLPFEIGTLWNLLSCTFKRSYLLKSLFFKHVFVHYLTLSYQALQSNINWSSTFPLEWLGVILTIFFHPSTFKTFYKHFYFGNMHQLSYNSHRELSNDIMIIWCKNVLICETSLYKIGTL